MEPLPWQRVKKDEPKTEKSEKTEANHSRHLCLRPEMPSMPTRKVKRINPKNLYIFVHFPAVTVSCFINVAHQPIFEGNNLDILRGFNRACVDLIYLDPPFNSKANYAAPLGSQAAGAAFKDTWGVDDIKLAWHGEIKHDYPALSQFLQATRLVHGDSMMRYLIYMAIRTIELKYFPESGRVDSASDAERGWVILYYPLQQ